MGEQQDDYDDDPWLRQFLAGQQAKERRARDTGWGCAFVFILFVIAIALCIAGSGPKP